jgi:hypothetical protein
MSNNAKPASGCTGPSDCSALSLAKQFHSAYERLAPSFGYETRTDTRDFDPDSPNGRLMVAVCESIIKQNAGAVPRRGSDVGSDALLGVPQQKEKEDGKSIV